MISLRVNIDSKSGMVIRKYIKRLIKFLFISCSVLIIAFGLFCLTVYFFSDQIKTKAIDEVNESLTAKIKVGQIDISFIKQFPRMSIVFKDVIIESSIKTPDNSNLLSVDEILFSLNSLELLKQNIQIYEIIVNKGYLNVITDYKGSSNLHIFKKSDNSSNKFALSFEVVKLNYLNIQYVDFNNKFSAKSKTTKTKLRFSDGKLTKINSSLSIAELKVKELLFNNVDFEINTDVEIDSNLFAFNNSKISIDGLDLSSDISLLKSNDIWNIDANIGGVKSNVADLLKYVPSKYLKKFSDFNLKGSVNWNFKYKGKLDNISSFSLCYSNANLVVKYQDSNFNLDDISGCYSNNKLLFDNVKCRFKNSSLLAGVNYNINSGSIELSLIGSVNLEDITQFNILADNNKISGLLKTECSFKFNTKLADGSVFKSIVLAKTSNFEISEAAYKNLNNGFSVEDINGIVRLGDVSKIESLSFKIGNSDFLLDGSLQNLLNYFKGNEFPLIVDATLTSNNLEIDNNLYYKFDNSTQSVPGIVFPDRMHLDLSLNINKFKYHDFTANNIKGIFNYKPRMITLSSIKMNSMDGKLFGGGVLAQKYNNDFTISSQAHFEKININKLFISFNDFNQKAISSSNLFGNFTGDVNFDTELDNSFKNKTDKINAEIDAEISNCILKNYEPIYKLKSYFNEKDLSQVSFESIRNHITIKNSVLSFPKMEIISSSADVLVSGNHSFDNVFDYRMAIRLADIIKGKKKRISKNQTEWGRIEDDGAGQTVVFLKIIGTPKDYKISYDSKGAYLKSKETFIKQGSDLKNTFKNEFGANKIDTTKNKTKKKKFEIEWDEDSL